ncbi:hypothetical protein [Sphaerisporangium fuscum]|uniref:hypothetical protein n=1 Tax=Sphaerisporangium fuscum TaxID=2835868 RepID=UPI001BDCE471|nr:hypothetical protein [Sphaerisporangium fuscum]
MSRSQAVLEPFEAVQRIRYAVCCGGLSLMVLITTTGPWVVRHDGIRSVEVLSLWDLPGSDVRELGEHGVSALGMLMLSLALTLLTALRPARPLVLCTILTAVLSFVNTMWLDQALTGTAAHPAEVPAAAGPGVAAALGETFVLVLGLGALALVDTADDSDSVRRRVVSDGARWPADMGRRLAYAARGAMLSVLLLIGSTLPWMSLRHGEGGVRRLSLWDLANGSAGDQVTTGAAGAALALLIVSCVLLLLLAAEPERFLAWWVAVSIGVTLAALCRLHLVTAGLSQGRESVRLAGEAVTLAVLFAAAVVVIVPLGLPRSRRRPG